MIGHAGLLQSGVVSSRCPTAARLESCSRRDAATAFGNIGLGDSTWTRPKQLGYVAIKTTSIFREGQSLEFRAETFNTFNHPQFSNPVVTSNLPTFGSITTASVSPRIIQLALKYSF